MKSDSHPVLQTAHELRIGRARRGSEVTRSKLSIHREKPTKCELQSSTVAPGADRISESQRLGAAFEA
jgi:hypothetical protein